MYWSDESTNLHPKAPLPPPSQPQHQQEQPEEANRAAHTMSSRWWQQGEGHEETRQ